MSINMIDKRYGDLKEGKWPKELVYFTNKSKEEEELIFSALSGILEYLNTIYIL